MKFRSKSLLVTGGAGFIGSNFMNYLFNKYNNIKVVNLDLLTYAGNLDNLKSFKNHPKYKFVKGDICDKNLVENIFKEYQIDGVINFAAETHVDNSILNPDIFINTNINGVFNLINIAYKFWMESPFETKRKFQFARFHQISTDEVYGSIDKGYFTEDSKYAPNSPYSASKAAADMIVRSFNKTFGLNTTISTCSNNFGFNQNKEKFIPIVIDHLLKEKPIPVYGDGQNVRDWINVYDHCNAVDLIFNKSKDGAVYNIGANNLMTNLELINTIFCELGKLKKIKNPNMKFVRDRFGHDRRYAINSSKIKRDFNWKIENNFKVDLNKIILKIIA